MNKLLLIVALSVLTVGGFSSMHTSHAAAIQQDIQANSNLSANQTLNQTRTLQQNETALMTSQLVGYNKEYQLYVTVPGNNQNYTRFIQTFYLNVTSQGPSAVTVYEGESSIYTHKFDWAFDSLNAPHGLITINKTGHIMLTVQLHSYQTNLTRNVIYLLNFENTTTFVTYYNQQVQHSSTLPQIPIAVNAGTFILGGIVGTLGLMGSYTLIIANKKGWFLHKKNKPVVKAEKKKKWSDYFVPKRQL